jgi:hypothetical protein
VTDKNTGEYSSTKAPDTREHAEERNGNMTDPRLIPGGARGSHAPQGMEALDREDLPGRGIDPGQTRAAEPDVKVKVPD